MLRTTLTSRSSACGRLNSTSCLESPLAALRGGQPLSADLRFADFSGNRLRCTPVVFRGHTIAIRIYPLKIVCAFLRGPAVYTGAATTAGRSPLPWGRAGVRGNRPRCKPVVFRGHTIASRLCRPGKRSATGQGHRARRQSLARPVVNLFSLLAGMAAPKRARYFLSTVIMLTNG